MCKPLTTLLSITRPCSNFFKPFHESMKVSIPSNNLRNVGHAAKPLPYAEPLGRANLVSAPSRDTAAQQPLRKVHESLVPGLDCFNSRLHGRICQGISVHGWLSSYCDFASLMDRLGSVQIKVSIPMRRRAARGYQKAAKMFPA